MIKDIEKIKAAATTLGEFKYLSVQTNVQPDDDLITVGHITRCHRFREHLDLFAAPHETVFHRRVKNFNDVYSYKERTLAININVFHLLSDLDIRLVVTDFKDAKTHIAAVANFKTESDLGCGFLRRCPVEQTQQIAAAYGVTYHKDDLVANVFAAHRDTVIQQQIETRHEEFFDPRQSQLF